MRNWRSILRFTMPYRSWMRMIRFPLMSQMLEGFKFQMDPQEKDFHGVTAVVAHRRILLLTVMTQLEMFRRRVLGDRTNISFPSGSWGRDGSIGGETRDLSGDRSKSSDAESAAYGAASLWGASGHSWTPAS